MKGPMGLMMVDLLLLMVILMGVFITPVAPPGDNANIPTL
jgi:hypothetical protein